MWRYDRAMPLRHRWSILRGVRIALLTLVAELTGRSITARLDRAFHVIPLAAPHTPGYPLLLAGIRTVAALALAALAWRLLRLHATAGAAERLLQSVGGQRALAPRLKVRLSARLWLLFFAATSSWFLIENDLQRVSEGGWPLFAPWLHTYALGVFAVLSVVLALVWSVVRDWVSEVEQYAAATFERARRAVRRLAPAVPRRRASGEQPPRQRFGLAFESRPPPHLA
jgi:hypothetical protein